MWIITGGAGLDYLTVKYNNDGDEIWTKIYDGPGNGQDGGSAVGVDGNGNVYVTGFSYNGKDDTFTTIRYRK